MPRTCRVRVALPVALLLTWSLPAATIARVMTLDNPIRLPFSGFASSMAVIGDVDDDGIADYLVGAYDHPVNSNEHQGRAFVFSGRSGNLLYTIDNSHPMAYAAFGLAVAATGDLNHDRVPDLLIGAFGQEGSGAAFVFSGKEGKLLSTLHAPQRQVGACFG